MKKGLLLAIFITTPSVCLSNGNGITEEFNSCMSKAAGVHPAMIDCITSETTRQDDRTDRVYKSLVSRLDKQKADLLTASHVKFVEYMVASCAFFNDTDGGSSAELKFKDCAMSKLAERASELEAIASDPLL